MEIALNFQNLEMNKPLTDFSANLQKETEDAIRTYNPLREHAILLREALQNLHVGLEIELHDAQDFRS